MVRDAAHDYAQGKLAPRVLEAFRHEKTDPKIFREMGEIGTKGPSTPYMLENSRILRLPWSPSSAIAKPAVQTPTNTAIIATPRVRLM